MLHERERLSWLRAGLERLANQVARALRLVQESLRCLWSVSLAVRLPHVRQDHPLTAKAPAVRAPMQWFRVRQTLTSETAPPQDAAGAAAPQTRQEDGPPMCARPSACGGAATRLGQREESPHAHTTRVILCLG